MPHFFLSRYAANAKDASYIYRAVQSIRRIYPDARITVVDDGSPSEFEYEPDCELTALVQNPHPRSGEVGALMTAWSSLRAHDDVAITMHDSMVLAAPVVMPADSSVAFLWHFDRYAAMHLPHSLRLLSRLGLSDRHMLFLADTFISRFNADWRGCFGVSMAVTKAALDCVNSRCRLFDPAFMSAVCTREDRQAAERIVGLVFHMFAPGIPKLVPSLCGNIFDHPRPWCTSTASQPLDALLRSGYPAPFVKTWAGR